MKTIPQVLLLAVCSLAVFACTTAPTTEEDRAILLTRAEAALQRAKNQDPDLAQMLDNAYGYAVFPTVGKGAAGIGGAYGRGVLYEQGEFVGYCDVSQATIGLQLGGQAYTELILFEDKVAMDHFKSGNFAFDAQATAVALKSGASANARYANGVSVFTMGETGLMYEASIGGQKFGYQPK